jgi:hypothetical protein
MKISFAATIALLSAIPSIHGQTLPDVDPPNMDVSLQGAACEAWASDNDYLMGMTCAIMSLDGTDPSTIGVSQGAIKNVMKSSNPSFDDNLFFKAIGNAVQYGKFEVQSDYTYKLSPSFESSGLALALDNKKTAVAAAQVASTNTGGGGSKKSKGGAATSGTVAGTQVVGGSSGAGGGSMSSKSMGMMRVRRMRK